MNKSLILYAPNIHTGGGHVLLRALVEVWPAGKGHIAFLDERAKGSFSLPSHVRVYWVKPKFFSRAQAERLLQSISRAGDTVLCFHGLPPILSNAARIVVFQQNRIYIDSRSLPQLSSRVALRIGIERWISRTFSHRVHQYIVQTPSMARDLSTWLDSHTRGCSDKLIHVCPFIDQFDIQPRADTPNETSKSQFWDFVYVSDGVAHKNHRRLFAAWKLLASQGLKPRLAVTLGERDHLLIAELDKLSSESSVEIHNLGQMPRDQILSLYRHTHALIFPSITESFGLPLIEASQYGLPILAPESDYVRDVCEPVQTFDPMSEVSIMRAVKRFLLKTDPPIQLSTPLDLWNSVAPLHTGEPHGQP
ncbi:glycosyltransferase [Paucibacter sp. DJ2R-2]|uniref:glycosyltransferase n=1 Tax=Paucibacter sp. DJ2R-2 TaxID=2893558 RepID=UPI0021E3D243|nr:glycosyltransferase [Paucibacter sp. DJ2R-2]MCV2423103.1 glycosyltransferase [Paucibacter sp. DJ4R-1]MCV2440999.1 glycosyltransferase [Paucibacter sp. DJ2R-2]